jgi:hypothetical protein
MKKIRNFLFFAGTLAGPYSLAYALNTMAFMPTGWPWAFGMALTWLLAYAKGRYTRYNEEGI